MNRGVAVAIALSGASLAGCALTSKSEALMSRYFSPERSRRMPPRAHAGEPALELRLGRVRAGSHLGERIVYHQAPNELGFYEDRRWTEPPEEYLRRSLARTLFEERRLRHVVTGPAPTLEVELSAFEEIRSSPKVARVRVTARLLDERVARLEETITFDQRVDSGGSDDAHAFAGAMGGALDATVAAIADRVIEQLAHRRATGDAPCGEGTGPTAGRPR
jgi:cholesterol transport system auxiliary component